MSAAAAAQAATPAPSHRGGDVSEPVRPPDGFSIGHWTNAEGATGCTVVIAPPGSRGGVDVRGGGPGTRETDNIGPLAGTSEVSAGGPCGGGAVGLAAAGGGGGGAGGHGGG